jgi:signal transduction histidine kinase
LDAITIVVLEEKEADADRILDAVRAAYPGALVSLAPSGDALADLARRYAEVVAAARRRDEHLARAAHALRTPLNAMLGWASILRTRQLDDEARARAVEIIERNARREATLIDELLEARAQESERDH